MLLHKSSHFQAAMLEGWQIAVYQDNYILDSGGIIEAHTRDKVSNFIKSTCQFVVVNEQVEQDMRLLKQVKEEQLIEYIASYENGKFTLPLTRKLY